MHRYALVQKIARTNPVPRRVLLMMTSQAMSQKFRAQCLIRNIAVWNQGVKHRNFIDSIIIGIEKPLQMHRKCIINFEKHKCLKLIHIKSQNFGCYL